MAKKTSKDKELDKKILLAVGGLAIVAFLGFVLYTSNGLEGQLGARDPLDPSGAVVTVTYEGEGLLDYGVSSSVAGFSELTATSETNQYGTVNNRKLGVRVVLDWIPRKTREMKTTPRVQSFITTRKATTSEIESIKDTLEKDKVYGPAGVGSVDSKPQLEQEDPDATKLDEVEKVLTRKGQYQLEEVYVNADKIEEKDEIFVAEVNFETPEGISLTVHGKQEKFFVIRNDDGIPAQTDPVVIP